MSSKNTRRKDSNESISSVDSRSYSIDSRSYSIDSNFSGEIIKERDESKENNETKENDETKENNDKIFVKEHKLKRRERDKYVPSSSPQLSDILKHMEQFRTTYILKK